MECLLGEIVLQLTLNHIFGTCGRSETLTSTIIFMEHGVKTKSMKKFFML